MVILRGLPGAGKSHVAKIIKVNNKVCVYERESEREREYCKSYVAKKFLK